MIQQAEYQWQKQKPNRHNHHSQAQHQRYQHPQLSPAPLYSLSESRKYFTSPYQRHRGSHYRPYFSPPIIHEGPRSMSDYSPTAPAISPCSSSASYPPTPNTPSRDNNNHHSQAQHQRYQHPQLSPAPLYSLSESRKYFTSPYQRHRGSHYRPYFSPPIIHEGPRSMSDYSPTAPAISPCSSSASYPPTPNTPSRDNNNNNNNNKSPYRIPSSSSSISPCRLDSHSTPNNNAISIPPPPSRFSPPSRRLVFNFKKDEHPLRRHHSLDPKPTYLTAKKHCNCCPPSKP